MIISDFPVLMDVSDKFPEFEYTGEYTILDDGGASGEKKVAFLSSGILTLLNDAHMTVQAQGGGGAGGAGSSSSSGSDGADGSIEVFSGNLQAGEYAIDIGAAGSKTTDAAGGAGGTTSFGDLLTAAGGAGGARKGGASLEHSGLYSTYGQGGKGGKSSQYTGSVRDTYKFTGAGQNIYQFSSATPVGTCESGVTYYIDWGIVAAAAGNAYTINSGAYKGYCVLTSDISPTYHSTSDTRKWTGNAGYPGIVILSGKV